MSREGKEKMRMIGFHVKRRQNKREGKENK